MLIFLRDTDLDGQPIIGSGLMIAGQHAREVAEKMQASSPFNEGALTDYMRRVLEAAGDGEPLPEDQGEAARVFLERLARHGLLEFVKEAVTEVMPPEDAQEEDALCAGKQA